MPTVKYAHKFAKQYNKAGKDIQLAFEKRLDIFRQNQFHPLLNNHPLTGEYKGLRSINVTGDWRALYSEEEETIIVFELLGTHSQLYQ